MLPLSQKQTTFVFLLLLSLGLIVGAYHEQRPKALPNLKSGTALTAPRILPAFELRDQENLPFTRDRLLDQWNLLFFGYTHCPTICPQTLQLMKEVKLALPAPDLQFILISADPENDTPERLKTYLSKLDRHFIGLTGALSQIYELAKALGIFVAPAQEAIPHIPHSGALLLVNPQAELVAIFSSPEQASLLSQDILSLMNVSKK